METVPLESWECFEQHVSIMFSKWRKLKAEGKYNQWATPRFRGHADADWKLETTLERFTKNKVGPKSSTTRPYETYAPQSSP
jgi:hypothetical protein